MLKKFGLTIIGIFLVILFVSLTGGFNGNESSADGQSPPVDSLKAAGDSVGVKVDVTAEGKKLYRKKCSKCHSLYSPKEFRFKKWMDNLDEMRVKAGLKENEYLLIKEYLSETCKK